MTQALSAGLAHFHGETTDPVIEGSVGDALRRAAAAWGARVALMDGIPDSGSPQQWTFSALLREAEQVAGAMLRHFRPHEHVAVWAPNSPQWAVLEFAAALAGVTLVTVNPAYLASELEYVLTQSDAVGLFTVREYRGRDLVAVAETVRPMTPALRHIFVLGDWLALGESVSSAAEWPVVTADDIAQIQYTSGTTGFPKGALLTHRGLSNNARYFARQIGATQNDIWINPMPMFHTAGCGLVTLGALQTGGTHVMLPAYDPARMLELIETSKGTITLSVPTMLIGMLEHPDFASRDLSSWRLMALGGAPVTPELVRAARKRVPSARAAIGFGQTEASPYITHTSPDDPVEDWISTVGRPLPHCEVKVVDTASGATLGVGVVGEICTRGYAVMKGYFGNPSATEAAIDRDGWLHTGDLGILDAQGLCRIEGRLKDMIIRGGENIYPREIEEMLFTHPAIADAAVVGVPDPKWGEIPVAFVRLAGEMRPCEDDLVAFCRAHLAPYKTPRHWCFVDQFPQTPSGKIKKFALRDQFMSERGGTG
jgi:fatty-acyl-CoA synthase